MSGGYGTGFVTGLLIGAAGLAAHHLWPAVPAWSVLLGGLGVAVLGVIWGLD
jgi:hypothetical protein